MGGIVAGFMGGLASGTADAGKMLLADKLARERDEGNDARNRELRLDIQDDRQEFLSAERESTQDFTGDRDDKRYGHDKNMQDDSQTFKSDEAETERDWKSVENELDRWSSEGIADTKASSASGNEKATTNMKDAAELMRQGYPQDVANAIAHGGFVKHTDVEGNQIVVMPKKNGGFVEVGKIVTDNSGATQWVANDPNAPKAAGPLSKEELKNTAAEMNVDEGRGSDWIPFNEYGTDDDAVRANASKKRSQGGAKSGIVNAASQPSQSAKSATDAPYPDGTELKGKDGKTYIVTNGKPVLKE